MKYILDKLNKNNVVEFNPRGNSMTPKIKNGQLVKIKKLEENEKLKLKKGDIVFCKVKGNLYLHLITAINKDKVQIGNNHGKINGWTDFKNIYALLIER
jgi:hypothetical protein